LLGEEGEEDDDTNRAQTARPGGSPGDGRSVSDGSAGEDNGAPQENNVVDETNMGDHGDKKRKRAPRKKPVVPAESELIVPQSVQILELHHEKPLIAYNGHTYAAAWTQPIGTELFFATHEPTNPTPAIQRLPQDVDIVGASAARLVCKPVELRPIEAPAHIFNLQEVREQNGFAIPIHGDMNKDRRPQGAFLERLMNIKRRRGERDEVTVIAKQVYNEHVEDDEEERSYQRRKVVALERYHRKRSEGFVLSKGKPKNVKAKGAALNMTDKPSQLAGVPSGAAETDQSSAAPTPSESEESDIDVQYDDDEEEEEEEEIGDLSEFGDEHDDVGDGEEEEDIDEEEDDIGPDNHYGTFHTYDSEATGNKYEENQGHG